MNPAAVVNLSDAPSDCAISASFDEPVGDFPVLTYSKKQVIKAGKALAGPIIWDDGKSEEIREIFRVAWNWRDSHAYPMRKIRFELAGRIKRLPAAGITAARMKRMKSIRKKLARLSTTLVQIQDIGGTRAILPSMDDVNGLLKMYRESNGPHSIREDRSYIDNPKAGGYRSHHFVLEFQPVATGEEVFQGRRIEIQVRTKLQHAWATAVEAVGLVRAEDLKGGEGNADWLRLFDLMSSEFAVAENSPVGPNMPKRSLRLKEIEHLNAKLNAFNTLESLNATLKISETYFGKFSKFFLIEYDNLNQTVNVRSYQDSIKSAEQYDKREAQDASKTTVLVEVDKVENLKEAYPNYFLDVRLFAQNLSNLLEGKKPITLLPQDQDMTKTVRGYDLSFLDGWKKKSR